VAGIEDEDQLSCGQLVAQLKPIGQGQAGQ